jgi:hypothetical protein
VRPCIAVSGRARPLAARDCVHCRGARCQVPGARCQMPGARCQQRLGRHSHRRAPINSTAHLGTPPAVAVAGRAGG